MRMFSPALLILFLSISACAVPDYAKPINEMNSAIFRSVDYVTRIDREMTAAANERQKLDIISGAGLLVTREDACIPEEVSCGLEVIYRDGSSANYPIVSIMPNAQRPLDALKDYVTNLKAIVDAETTSDVKASANSALGNIANLNSAISDGEESGVSDYLTPASDALGWIAGQYVRAAKVSALREATSQAQPVIDDLDGFYSVQLDAVAAYSVARASAAFVPQQESFGSLERSQLSVTKIIAFERAAADYDRALRVTQINPISAFSTAHRALRNQLNDEGASFAEVMAAVGRLREEARALKEIYESFEEVSGNAD